VTDVTDVTPGKQKEEATTAKAFEERAAKLDPDLPDFLRRRP